MVESTSDCLVVKHMHELGKYECMYFHIVHMLQVIETLNALIFQGFEKLLHIPVNVLHPYLQRDQAHS